MFLVVSVNSASEGHGDSSVGNHRAAYQAAVAPDVRPNAQHDSIPDWVGPNERSSDLLVTSPQTLMIPSLDLRTAVHEVGVSPRGVVHVPADVSTVGWVDSTVVPGAERGSSVIVGHRDGPRGENGALYDIGRLDVGAKIQVANSNSVISEFTVISREVIVKSEFGERADEFFSRSGDARLTMITCGGEYDKDNGGYLANVVVTALPIG